MQEIRYLSQVYDVFIYADKLSVYLYKILTLYNGLFN